MLSKISSMLDAIADRLERKGLIKEAYEIDKIADQIDPPSKVRPGRHVTDNEISEQFLNIIEKSETSGPADEDPGIQRIIQDIEYLASDYNYGDEDIYKKYYKGWGRDDFKKLLQHYTDLKTRRVLPPHDMAKTPQKY